MHTNVNDTRHLPPNEGGFRAYRLFFLLFQFFTFRNFWKPVHWYRSVWYQPKPWPVNETVNLLLTSNEMSMLAILARKDLHVCLNKASIVKNNFKRLWILILLEPHISRRLVLGRNLFHVTLESQSKHNFNRAQLNKTQR